MTTKDTTVNRFASTQKIVSHVHATMGIDCWQTRKTVKVGAVVLIPKVYNLYTRLSTT